MGKIWTMFTEQMRDKSKNISVVMDEFGKCRLPFLLYYLVYTQNIEKKQHTTQFLDTELSWILIEIYRMLIWFGCDVRVPWRICMFIDSFCAAFSSI